MNKILIFVKQTETNKQASRTPVDKVSNAATQTTIVCNIPVIHDQNVNKYFSLLFDDVYLVSVHHRIIKISPKTCHLGSRISQFTNSDLHTLQGPLQ